MAQPRKTAPARPAPKPAGAASVWQSAIAALRPEPSRRGVLRLTTRAAIACGTVGILAVLSTWSASGFLDRGGLDHLVRMKNTPARQPADVQAQRGRLDRSRLNSVLTATGSPRS